MRLTPCHLTNACYSVLCKVQLQQRLAVLKAMDGCQSVVTKIHEAQLCQSRAVNMFHTIALGWEITSEINDHTNCIMTTPTLYNYHTQHIIRTSTNCPMTAPTCIDISLICPLPDIPDKNATPHLVRERERRRGHRERQRRSTGALLR